MQLGEQGGLIFNPGDAVDPSRPRPNRAPTPVAKSSGRLCLLLIFEDLFQKAITVEISMKAITNVSNVHRQPIVQFLRTRVDTGRQNQTRADAARCRGLRSDRILG